LVLPEVRGKVGGDFSKNENRDQQGRKTEHAQDGSSQHQNEQQGKNPPQGPDELILHRTPAVLPLPEKIADEREQMADKQRSDRKPKLSEKRRFVQSGRRADPGFLPRDSSEQGRGANEEVSVNEKKESGQEYFCDRPQDKCGNIVLVRLGPEPDRHEKKLQRPKKTDQDAIAPIEEKQGLGVRRAEQDEDAGGQIEGDEAPGRRIPGEATEKSPDKPSGRFSLKGHEPMVPGIRMNRKGSDNHIVLAIRPSFCYTPPE
jgi:hypothetical protein